MYIAEEFADERLDFESALPRHPVERYRDTLLEVAGHPLALLVALLVVRAEERGLRYADCWELDDRRMRQGKGSYHFI